MRKFIRDIFKEENGKWSFTRIFVLVPIIGTGIYEILEFGNNIVQSAWACAILISFGCFGRFFNRFIDNGAIEKIISAICSRLNSNSNKPSK